MSAIKINLDDEQSLFRAYVELIQPILSLTNREIAVFAQLLMLNNQKQTLAPADRFEIIFGTKSRKAMAADLNMSEPTLQNIFSELRKKRVIVNNTIPKGFWVYPKEGTLELIFNLKLKSNG
jgi:AraC-like DNA-binding protein